MSTIDASDLYESARGWRERAVGSFFLRDTAVGLTFAGISTEHLCKAYLAHRSPTFVIEFPKDPFETLLQLNGEDIGYVEPRRIKTIAPVVAWERVQKLLPDVRVDKKEVLELIEIRNGVLHSATLPEPLQRSLFTQFILLTNQIEESLPNSMRTEPVWPDTWQRLIANAISADQQAMQGKIKKLEATAQEKVKAHLEKLSASDAATRRGILQADNAAAGNAVVENPDEWGKFLNTNISHFETIKCPITNCKDDNALALGWISNTFDGNRFVRTFHAVQFRCGVCGFHLPGILEVAASGIDTHWEIS